MGWWVDQVDDRYRVWSDTSGQYVSDPMSEDEIAAHVVRYRTWDEPFEASQWRDHVPVDVIVEWRYEGEDGGIVVTYIQQSPPWVPPK